VGPKADVPCRLGCEIPVVAARACTVHCVLVSCRSLVCRISDKGPDFLCDTKKGDLLTYTTPVSSNLRTAMQEN
jgi:hypothetical protein